MWRLPRLAAGLAGGGLLGLLLLGRLGQVAGDSMRPTLQHGDLFVTLRSRFRLIAPRRGQVVVFEHPHQPGVEMVKRILALSGDRIEIRCGPAENGFAWCQTWVNGAMVHEPYVTQRDFNHTLSLRQVCSDAVFVMGDNRAQSEDSRTWGPVSLRALRGLVAGLVWPLERMHLLP